MATQQMMIKEHLINHGNISGKEAFLKYGVYRLSDVILKLREKGCDIETINITYTDEDGKNKRYGRYFWRGETDAE